jgi:putative PIN family toxin of toxin-antitoxin system
MKVVLDTNVLVSALIVKAGKPAQTLRRVESFELLITEEILAETERVLNYSRIRKRYLLSDQDVSTYIDRLTEVGTVLQVNAKVEVIEDDPDDDKFLALAKEAQADYIVSGDVHLTALSEYKGTSILTPNQFLELLQSK